MRIKARATMVLARRTPPPRSSAGGIIITHPESIGGGEAFDCCVIDVGPPGIDARGLHVTSPVHVGDRILCPPHAGEKVCERNGEEIWAIDWSDIIGIVKE